MDFLDPAVRFSRNRSVRLGHHVPLMAGTVQEWEHSDACRDRDY